MKLKRIEIKNFKCWKDLTFDIPEKGFYFLTGENKTDARLGSNGIGKSTLCDAMLWCLFGYVSNGMKPKELLNYNTGAKGYSVTMHFDDHIVTRTWGPISFQIDGRQCHDKEIATILPINGEQFQRSIYFAKDAKYFVDASASDKLAFLSKLFDLDNWVKYSDAAKTKIDAKKREIDSMIKDIGYNERQVGDIDAEITRLTDLKDTWDQTHLKEVDDLLASIVRAQAQLSPTPDLVQIDTQIKSINVEIGKCEMALSAGRRSWQEQTAAKAKITSEINHKNSLIEKMMNSADSICPECQQVVEFDHVEKFALDLTDTVGDLEIQQAGVAKLLATITTDITQKEQLVKSWRESITKLNQEYAEGQKEVAEQANLRKQIEQGTKDYDVKKLATNPHAESLETWRKKKDAIGVNAESLKKKLEKLEHDHGLLVLAQKHLLLVRLWILGQLTDYLKISLNRAFNMLGLVGWYTEIDTERETVTAGFKKEINLRIFKPDREVIYGGLSSGERQRVRLASGIGISDLVLNFLGIDLNIRIFDEPSDGLHEWGRDDMLDSLSILGEDLTVFLSDHMMFEYARFTSVYRIIKQLDGNSDLIKTCD